MPLFWPEAGRESLPRLASLELLGIEVLSWSGVDMEVKFRVSRLACDSNGSCIESDDDEDGNDDDGRGDSCGSVGEASWRCIPGEAGMMIWQSSVSFCGWTLQMQVPPVGFEAGVDANAVATALAWGDWCGCPEEQEEEEDDRNNEKEKEKKTKQAAAVTRQLAVVCPLPRPVSCLYAKTCPYRYRERLEGEAKSVE